MTFTELVRIFKNYVDEIDGSDMDAAWYYVLTKYDDKGRTTEHYFVTDIHEAFDYMRENKEQLNAEEIEKCIKYLEKVDAVTWQYKRPFNRHSVGTRTLWSLTRLIDGKLSLQFEPDIRTTKVLNNDYA